MTLVDELKNAGMSETDIRLFIGSLHRAVCFMCCKTPCSRCILNGTGHCNSVGNMSKKLYLSLTDDMQKHPEVYERQLTRRILCLPSAVSPNAAGNSAGNCYESIRIF